VTSELVVVPVVADGLVFDGMLLELGAALVSVDVPEVVWATAAPASSRALIAPATVRVLMSLLLWGRT
jgi:hypothetical protein